MPIVNYNRTKTMKNTVFSILSEETPLALINFKTGFHGLADMTTEFQKALDYTLMGLQNTICYLGDIFTVSTGSESDQLNYVAKCLQKLDEDKLRIKLQKCHFAKTEIQWLRYRFTQTGISPLENKTTAILAAINPPLTLNRLISLLGSIHY